MTQVVQCARRDGMRTHRRIVRAQRGGATVAMPLRGSGKLCAVAARTE